MLEIIAALLSSPVVRSFVEECVIHVVADIFHRRDTDPTFRAQSDAAFAQLSQAKTPEEKIDAQKVLQSLLADNPK